MDSLEEDHNFLEDSKNVISEDLMNELLELKKIRKILKQSIY
ncbi:hypothetical protein [Hathewaya histolytica]